ncbi:MAG TPA: ParA family protein [Rhizomicrobium sp.]|jgi:septum site-determining protein MinD|nr:ParA family protein [Rhizomicrobium sp.]
MKVINVVSGKGGTGKTLIVAVLAELLSRKRSARVLLVDLDVFVRGLTTLLYFEGDRRTRLISPEQLAVSDILVTDSPRSGLPGIVRYHSFDVWPSVARVDQRLLSRDVVPDSFEIAKERVGKILQAISSEYDVVLLDGRAGFDELVAATFVLSDITINIEEDDLVSSITSDNLIAQLNDVDTKPIYRIVNKSYGRHHERVADLGRIPFDADIMKSYGEDEFWFGITRSLIEPALVKIWNSLCRNEGMKFFIESFRHSAFPVASTDRWLSQLTSVQRLLGVYGFLLSLGGFSISIGGERFFYQLTRDPIALGGAIAAIFGIAMLLAVFLIYSRRRSE